MKAESLASCWTLHPRNRQDPNAVFPESMVPGRSETRENEAAEREARRKAAEEKGEAGRRVGYVD